MIKINNTILNNVYNKTEVWDMCGKINYCALFCDNNNIRVSLPKKVILKYNLLDKVMCKNKDNKIYLYLYLK